MTCFVHVWQGETNAINDRKETTVRACPNELATDSRASLLHHSCVTELAMHDNASYVTVLPGGKVAAVVATRCLAGPRPRSSGSFPWRTRARPRSRALRPAYGASPSAAVSPCHQSLCCITSLAASAAFAARLRQAVPPSLVHIYQHFSSQQL